MDILQSIIGDIYVFPSADLRFFYGFWFGSGMAICWFVELFFGGRGFPEM